MLIRSSHDLPPDFKGALSNPLYLLNYMCDRIETLHVSTEGIVIDKNWPNLLITSSHYQSRDIKGPLFKALYRLNYIPDLVETLQKNAKKPCSVGKQTDEL